MTDQPKIDWREWRKNRSWLSDTERPIEPLELPMNEDEFSFFLSEQEWATVHYALRYYLSAMREKGVDTGSILTAIDDLAPENWAEFRLSRDRFNGLKSHTIVHPGPTGCCQERMFKPTQGARWRCYGCGRMLSAQEFSPDRA